MGLTQHTLDLIEPYAKKGITMLELGCQNLYGNQDYGAIAVPYWEAKGIDITSVDLEGCNDSDVLDLDKFHGKRWKKEQYDVVTDAGTSEHCTDFYNTWKNKFHACKTDGFIISENPRTRSWPGHGNSYVTIDFYKELEAISDLEIITVGNHPAMGNTTDGWNVYCIVKRTGDKFPDRATFEKLSYHDA
jgi:hypothetical protein